jgi:rsbT co-antagonist protein RsbR
LKYENIKDIIKSTYTKTKEETYLDANLKLLGNVILEKRFQIAHTVHKSRMAQMNLTIEENKKFKTIEESIIEIRASFVKLFGEALIEHTDKEKAIEKINAWGKETGEHLFKLKAPLNEALADTSYYREYLWREIEKEAVAREMNAATIFKVLSIIDPLLDEAVYSFSLTYIQFYEETLKRNEVEFLKISVPVVPLSKGVAILPLIGNINAARAKIIMEETIKTTCAMNLEQLIIDLSGIIKIDTMEADQIFRLIDSLKLVGIKTVITGIRPEVARLVVVNGIDFKGINTKANLQQAISDSFKKL